jgi:hypothetical protein
LLVKIFLRLAKRGLFDHALERIVVFNDGHVST